MARRHYDWIRHHAAMTPDKPALIDLHSGRRHTYAGLDRRIDALARHLRAAFALRPDDCIAVLCHNSTDIYEVQFACRRIPALFLPINWRLSVSELQYVLQDSKTKLLFVGEEFEDAGRKAAAAAGVPHVLTIRDGRPSDYEQAIAAGEGDAPLEIPSLREDAVWTIMYTSGTTGRPKGALITYAMVDTLASHVAAKIGLSPHSVSLTVLPMFHISGLNTHGNPVLYWGGTNYVMRTYDAAVCLELISNPATGLTHFMGVPTHFLFMTELPQFEQARFDHLENVISGGAAVPIPMVETFAARGMQLQQGWGMTETCSLILLLPIEDLGRKRGSVGRPVMNVELRIVDPELNDVAPGEVGELLVRGPQIAPGYLNKPEANATQWVDEWFRTGDAFRVDDEGYYYIVDRWKDMYISGGENVYPAEVERVIIELDDVLEVAVVGIPHPRWGEVGRAYIVLRQGASGVNEAAIIQHCRASLAAYKAPFEVVFQPELPHTPAGKIMKHALSRATAESG